jgi:hypothetical protein
MQLLKAIERSRGHAASFVAEDTEAIRKREIAEAGGTAALETESEYSADLPETQPALRLAVRAKASKSAAASPQKLSVDLGGRPPVRSVIEYQLTAAQMPPPFLASMQVWWYSLLRYDGCIAAHARFDLCNAADLTSVCTLFCSKSGGKSKFRT